MRADKAKRGTSLNYVYSEHTTGIATHKYQWLLPTSSSYHTHTHNTLTTQMAKKLKAENKAAREATKAHYKNLYAEQDREQDKFDRYVEKEIAEYGKAGKNVKALAHALRKGTDLMSAF